MVLFKKPIRTTELVIKGKKFRFHGLGADEFKEEAMTARQAIWLVTVTNFSDIHLIYITICARCLTDLLFLFFVSVWKLKLFRNG